MKLLLLATAALALGKGLHGTQRTFRRPSLAARASTSQRCPRQRLIARGLIKGGDQDRHEAQVARRNFLGGIAAVAPLAFLKAQAVNPVEYMNGLYGELKPKNVMITGANSGIGRSAVEDLVSHGHTVYVVCRTLEKAQKVKEEICSSQGLEVAPRIVPLECDLADLTSVRKFVSDFHSQDYPLDVLVANAGLSLNANEKGDDKIVRTNDGFELTVGTNYLGHFLLVNLLLGDLEKRPGSRVVITGSEVHDPSSPGGSVGPGASLGNLSGLESKAGMVDGGSYDADKAYKDSKLCDVMFALELNRRLNSKGSSVTVNAFGPGLITRSGFFRNQNPLFAKLFDVAVVDIFRVAETVEFGGACMTYMALSPELDGKGGLWLNAVKPGAPVFEELEPSVEARDKEKAKLLFDTSSRLVGLV